MMEKGVCVVGYGLMGRHYARLVREHPRLRLAGVVDVNAQRLAEARDAWGVPVADDASALLSEDNVDIALIATPDPYHLEPVLAAVVAGKPVFLEKPLATTVADALKIVDACEKNSVPLFVAHTLRFDPRYSQGREVVAAGDIGNIIHMYTRRNGVSGRRLSGVTECLFYGGIHDIDVMCWFTGQRVDAVVALGRKLTLADLGVYDTIFALLRFADGTIAALESSWALPNVPGGRPSPILEIVGTEGMINVHGYEQGLSIQTVDRSDRPNVIYEPVVYGRQQGLYRYELDHFLDGLERNEFAITPREALHTVEIAEAILKSLAEEGSWVDVSSVSSLP